MLENNMHENSFYKNLKKPSFTPPAFVFRWVWGLLYFLMLVSFLMILFSPSSFYKIYAVAIFILQLFLNLIWSPIFFIYKKIKSALFVCIALAFCVLLMIFVFYKVSKIAAILQIPYLIWLMVAISLNASIVRLNPDIKN